MPKRFAKLAYILTFVALIGFFAFWKLFSARESPEYLAQHQRIIEITAANVSDPALSGNADDALRIYGVHVVHTPPFKDPFIGYGIYLGRGLVLTAAHVVGRLPGYSRPRVVIGGEDLAAKVLKQGSPDETDLALLSVDQNKLPASLQLRRDPLCQFPLQVGMGVIVVYPERTVRSQIISPLLIPQQYRAKYPTLINESQGSGSGVFSADKKCLIGIMSGRVTKYAYQSPQRFMTMRENGYAGYFVPVSKGSTFLQHP
jgi:trypsin-like peptidase